MKTKEQEEMVYGYFKCSNCGGELTHRLNWTKEQQAFGSSIPTSLYCNGCQKGETWQYYFVEVVKEDEFSFEKIEKNSSNS